MIYDDHIVVKLTREEYEITLISLIKMRNMIAVEQLKFPGYPYQSDLDLMNAAERAFENAEEN